MGKDKGREKGQTRSGDVAGCGEDKKKAGGCLDSE
jgi:hypothetical protein